MSHHTPPEVESYSFGRMTVAGEEHTNDLILLPDRVLGNWWRDEGHRLAAADLDAVFEAEPETLVVGTGANDRMAVPEATRKAIEDAGIRLIAQPTGQAVETYNRERQGTGRLAAAFHLTC
jgi:hypothetical protein